MTAGDRTDTLAAMVAYIYNHASWSASYQVHGVELPPGWQLTQALLILPDGGPARLDIPVTQEQYTFWCYGLTPAAAREVADKLTTVLHRANAKRVTLTGGTAIMPVAERTNGPMYLREPDTEWPRWVCGYSVVWSEWVV